MSFAIRRFLATALVLLSFAPAQAPAQDAGPAKPREVKPQAAATKPQAAKPKAAPEAIGAATFEGLRFRNIGPAIMGGRVDDFAVVESDPKVFYVAMASGGILKTVNNGLTFEPVFDDQQVSSIGDLALAPSDPQVLYAGTGEPNNRQSSSWGNGVYKSVDGGQTWTNVGLEETHHIGRVVIHPRNPDVVYVAALGRLWGASKERGLYRTTDGGKSWTSAKFVDEDTGFVDVAIDPESPGTLYAASYQRRRTPFGYNGGGKGSAIWKTTDGGISWTRLSKGLPSEGDVGRIGLDVYRRDPRIVYALVEHEKESGIYRSDDRGETWKKMSNTNPRPSYYSKVTIDPNNDQRIWVLGAQVFFSEDGGKTFATDRGGKIHGDYHRIWIDPADSSHMLAGTDGGIHISYDRGRNWDYVNTLPLGQCYEVSADNRDPYNVYCGLQDNGSWGGPSRTAWQQGIANEDWFRVGGGDGFYTVVDPADPDTIYVESQDGNVARLDTRTWERRVIRPEPPEGTSYRFNWNSPIVVSPHDHKTIYYGGNRVFGSRDRGETWTTVSGDLTNAAPRDTLEIFGKTSKQFLSRNDGVVHFGTITTLAESPLRAGVLWAGTDDGNLQVSKDGGATWTNVTGKLPGVPKGTYVSRVEPSRTGEGAAYVAFDGHRGNDFGVYIFRTEDFGASFKPVAGNIPPGFSVSVVREHPKNPDLLFAGTENALWASFNRGASWVRMKSGLPTVPVDDLLIHPRDNDLVLATHGRSLWVLDDVAALQHMSDATAAQELRLFPTRPAKQWRMYGHKGNTGAKFFIAENPPDGALVTYYLKAKPGEKDEVKVTIADAAGKTVRELKGPKEAGVNRVAWDLRHEPPIRPEPGEGGGGGGFFGPPRGTLVPPGTYTVTVAAASAKETGTVQVLADPRLQIAEADRNAWYEAAQEAGRIWARADAVNRGTQALKRQLSELETGLKRRQQTPEAVTQSLKALQDKVSALSGRMTRDAPLGFAGAPLADEPDPLLNRARGAYFATQQYTAPPTPQQRQAFLRTAREVGEAVTAWNAISESDVPAFNKLMFDNGVGRVEPGRKVQ